MQIFVSKKYRSWLVATNIVILLIGGCQSRVRTQCTQLTEIANRTNKQLSHILQTEQVSNQDFQMWLQAIDIFDRAIAKLKSLPIQDEHLLVYQEELANLWQVYAHATKEAIEARKIKSLSMLTKATSDANEADIKLQQVIQQINSYCN